MGKCFSKCRGASKVHPEPQTDEEIWTCLVGGNVASHANGVKKIENDKVLNNTMKDGTKLAREIGNDCAIKKDKGTNTERQTASRPMEDITIEDIEDNSKPENSSSAASPCHVRKATEADLGCVEKEKQLAMKNASKKGNKKSAEDAEIIRFMYGTDGFLPIREAPGQKKYRPLQIKSPVAFYEVDEEPEICEPVIKTFYVPTMCARIINRKAFHIVRLSDVVLGGYAGKDVRHTPRFNTLTYCNSYNLSSFL